MSLLRLLPAVALSGLLAAALALPVRADEPPTDHEPAKAATKADAKEKDLIPWMTTYASATKAAETSGKPILWDFYTGWCPHCTRMDKTTWKDPGVAKIAESFVVAKVNCDVEKVPVSRYRLTGYPTVVVAEPGGEQVLRMEGYKDAAAISAALKAYLGSAADLKQAFATLKTDKKNAAAHLAVGDFYTKASLHDQAADSYQKAAKAAQGAELVRASASAGSALVKAGKAKEASKVLAGGLAAAGSSPTPDLLLALAQSEAALGRPDAAREWVEKLEAAAPGSPQAAEARKSLPGA